MCAARAFGIRAEEHGGGPRPLMCEKTDTHSWINGFMLTFQAQQRTLEGLNSGLTIQ